jgi:ribonuclease HII
MLIELDKLHPEYDFKHNKGYGTKKHIEALMKYGPLKEHRKSFEPVKSILEKL